MVISSKPQHSLALAAPDARGRCKVSQSCGGCPQIEVSPQQTREAKARAILQLAQNQDCLAPLVSCFVRSSPLGYRNRIRLRVLGDGSFGFFNERKSSECVVLEPSLRATLEALRHRLGPAAQALTHFSHLELRMPDHNGQAGLFLARKPGASAPNESSCTAIKDVILGALAGLPLVLGGLDEGACAVQKFMLTEQTYHYVPVDGFMQVNHTINREVIDWLCTASQAQGVRRVLDLYCGSGNFSLPLLAEDHEVIGVELNSSSIQAARRAALDQNLLGEFIVSDVAQWLSRGTRRPDLIVVDAPRAGMKGAAWPIAQLNASHLALISCNAKSFFQDIQHFKSLGYSINELHLFDMFPYTDHVELGAWLSLRALTLDG